MVLFVYFALRESIGFTGVLWDWWVVNRCVLMCYFFIKYMVFGWVRLKPYFIRAERYFWWDSGDFWWCENGWNAWFLGVLSNSLSKWCFELDLGEMSRKRLFYKESVDRTDVPVYLANKCSKNVNYAPILALKHTIIVQYYCMFLLCQVKILYTLR